MLKAVLDLYPDVSFQPSKFSIVPSKQSGGEGRGGEESRGKEGMERGEARY